MDTAVPVTKSAPNAAAPDGDANHTVSTDYEIQAIHQEGALRPPLLSRSWELHTAAIESAKMVSHSLQPPLAAPNGEKPTVPARMYDRAKSSQQIHYPRKHRDYGIVIAIHRLYIHALRRNCTKARRERGMSTVRAPFHEAVGNSILDKF